MGTRVSFAGQAVFASVVARTEYLLVYDLVDDESAFVACGVAAEDIYHFSGRDGVCCRALARGCLTARHQALRTMEQPSSERSTRPHQAYPRSQFLSHGGLHA